ncbi:MAG: MBL fold metallo-hydrolase [Candidatus Magasanikbacteria bacterium]|nr:MBL fold metallo-hydrolase [Candidatus Magasanikbacteria bacterium]
MHISWLGQTCVKLQTKNLDKDITVLLDAYKPKKGDFPRSFSPDVALFSQGLDNAATISQGAFVVNSLGEMEVKNLMIYAVPGSDTDVIYKLNAEGLNIVHLGRLKSAPPTEHMEKIMSPDILFIPVGGGQNYLDAKAAAALATTLEPRMIIPIAYNCDTDPDAAPITAFVKEMGLKPESGERKVIIKKKDLPQEETKMIVLEKE